MSSEVKGGHSSEDLRRQHLRTKHAQAIQAPLPVQQLLLHSDYFPLCPPDPPDQSSRSPFLRRSQARQLVGTRMSEEQAAKAHVGLWMFLVPPTSC